jgi:tetratricopeptide (TPR) repeat protein
MPRTTIASTAADLLAEHRALAPEELGQLIVARGLTRSKQPARAVSRALDVDRRFRQLSDGRWAVPAQLLRGATLTHRVTAGEAATDVLALTPDLTPLMALASDGLLLPDGQPLTVLWDQDAADASGIETDIALQGPPGWLASSSPGHLVHVRVTGAILRVGSGPEPRAESRIAVRRLVEATRTRLSQQKATEFLLLPPAVSLDTLILDLLADDSGLLEYPLPPLGEALAAAGLEVHRSFVGPPGTDWEAIDAFMSFDQADLDVSDDDAVDEDDALDDDHDEIAERELEQHMVEAFDLEPADVEGLGIVLAAYDLSRRLGGLDSADVTAGLARILASDGIVRVLGLKAWTDPAFEPFVAAIASAATGRDAAGPRFLLGACAEARGDVDAAERLFRSVLDADARNPLALIEVARYETDRGNYAAALGHLRAARVPTADPERAWLEGLVVPAVPKVGRNEPCPCGSGRKYKACHLDSPGEVRPVDAAKALLHKLDAWLSQPDMQRIGEAVLRESEPHGRGTGTPAPVADADRPIGPILNDIVLYDRGGLRTFLDVRGALLPAAERALGRTWLLGRRSLYEVQAVRPGSSVTVRDLRADSGSVEVADRAMSGQLQPLDLLCMRLLPDGAGRVVPSDGILVPRTQRRLVLDLLDSGDGLALLRWIVTPAPLPRLANTEGEPIQLITAVFRVPDPAAAAVALGRKLRDDGDGRFVETIARHGQEWIRGSITLDGDRATIDANSGKRAARLERTLLRAAPGARLIRREERGIEEALEEERAKGPVAGDAEGATHGPIDVSAHPELAEAMDAFIRRSEASWVDESIPALGGLTPRQAAADRAARPELEALLDDMAWQQRRAGGGGLMDPSRVRALLGIPPGA